MKIKNSIVLLIICLVFVVSCCEDTPYFNSTEHPIIGLAENIRYSIVVDNYFYNFSVDSNLLNCEGDSCAEYIIEQTEMFELVEKLSDTIIFKWTPMNAEFSNSIRSCNMLIYSDINLMCSIGSGEKAVDLLNELSKSLTGEGNAAFSEIINRLK